MTNVHCLHLWRYVCPYLLSFSLIIPMVQLWISGSPTYGPLPPLLQLHLPPHPYIRGLCRGWSQRVTNVHCIHFWCYLYLFPLSISLIIPMVQLWISRSPTYGPLTPLLQLQLPPHPYSGDLCGGGAQGDKCTLYSPLALRLSISFVYFFDNPHGTAMDQRIPDL